jgi:hypothetical protein
MNLRRPLEYLISSPPPNHLWLNSMVTRNIGGDIGLLVIDVKRVETTGRNRDTARRARNTMGYRK